MKKKKKCQDCEYGCDTVGGSIESAKCLCKCHEMKKENCEHKDFKANVNVIRLKDSGRFQVEVQVMCRKCKTMFQFMGLPIGLNLSGASMSVDGLEARLSIMPQGTLLHPLNHNLTKHKGANE